MLALSLFAAATAPSPAPPPGTPPTTIADLIRIEGACSLSVLIVGDDGLSQQFNSAVIRAVAKSERDFCHRARGNYVLYTNSNVVPTRSGGFRYHVTVHDAREFIAHHNSGGYQTLAAEEKDCRSSVSSCANQAVSDLLRKLEVR